MEIIDKRFAKVNFSTLKCESIFLPEKNIKARQRKKIEEAEVRFYISRLQHCSESLRLFPVGCHRRALTDIFKLNRPNNLN